MTFQMTEKDRELFHKAYRQNRIHLHEDEVPYHIERLEYLAKWLPAAKSMRGLIDTIYPIGFGYCSDNKLWPLLKEAHNEFVKAGNKPDHRVDIYVEYDVLFHHCIDFKQRKVAEVYQYVMENIPDGLFDEMDYFAISGSRKTKGAEWPKFHWVSVYYVTGGSEGFYLHVDTINSNDGGNDRDTMLIGKTLLEGQAGRDYMADVCKVLSEILCV